MPDSFIELDVSGVDQFLAELEVEHRALNAWVNHEYRRLVEIVFFDILQGTPQWSGNLAANWFIGINSENETEETIPDKAVYWPLRKEEPYSLVDPNYAAIGISAARMENAGPFSYLDEIYIYNPAYPAQRVEDHTIYLRPVNTLDGRVMMVQYAATKYESFNPL